MKTIFIHFSDLHLNQENSDNLNVDFILNPIDDSIENASRIFLLFTGDFTSSGSKEEIQLFNKLITNVVEKIKKYNNIASIKTIFVPGNHDIDLSSEDEKGYILERKKKYTEEELDNLAITSLDSMKESLEMCNKNGCFCGSSFVDNLVFESDNFIYNFNLINSAPFSSKEKVDKEHHHIPLSELKKLSLKTTIGKKTIGIFVAHHRTDWFDYRTSSYLNEFLKKNVSIAFYGHEHTQNEMISISNGNALLNIYGGELLTKENALNGSFNILVFDEEKCKCNVDEISYDLDSGEYKLLDEKIIDQEVNYFSKFKNTKEFFDQEYKSPLKNHNGTILDLFVMPTLYKNDKPSITSVDQLVSTLAKKHELYIKGGTKYGKSILLKYLYCQLAKNSVPILIRCKESMSPVVTNSIEAEFKSQYLNGSEKYKQFNALPKNEKVILIDNLHILKKETMKKMISYAKEHFGAVVVTYSSGFDPEKRLDLETTIGFSNLYELYPFSYLDRKNLAQNVCLAMGLEGENITKVFKVYEATVDTSKIVDFADPDYAIALLESIIVNKNYEERDVKNAFTIAFTNAVQNAFISAGCGGKLNDCIQLSSWLARDIWQEQNSFAFSEDFAMSSYEKCCKWYKNITISFIQYMRILEDSQLVIRMDTNNYRFRRLIYLSYFAGLQIANDYSSNNKKDLKNLLNKINEWINSDVLLFVSYELKEKKLFENIKNLLEDIFNTLEPISFNPPNNALISAMYNKELTMSEPSFTKEERNQRKDQKEKEKMPALVKKEEEDHIESKTKFEQYFKLIEIMSKAVSGFNSLFNGNERKKYIDAALNASLRIIQHLFTIDEKSYKDLENRIAQAKETILEENKDRDDFETIREIVNSIDLSTLLYKYLVSAVSALEFQLSDWMASGSSVALIEELDDKLVTNRLFKLFTYIHMGSFEKYKNNLNKALSTFKDKKIQILFKPTVFLYLINNDINYMKLSELSKASGIPTSTLQKFVPLGQLVSKK